MKDHARSLEAKLLPSSLACEADTMSCARALNGSSRDDLSLRTCCSALQKCKVKVLDVLVLTLTDCDFPGSDSTKLQPNPAQKNMKTPHSFSRNRFFSSVRFASAGALFFAAAAMAFVAVKSIRPILWAKSDSKSAINKFSQNRTALFRNKLAMPGPEREGGPMAAAEEDYANRADPAAYVPFELTRNAHRAWTNVRARARRGEVGPQCARCAGRSSVRARQTFRTY